MLNIHCNQLLRMSDESMLVSKKSNCNLSNSSTSTLWCWCIYAMQWAPCTALYIASWVALREGEFPGTSPPDRTDWLQPKLHSCKWIGLSCSRLESPALFAMWQSLVGEVPSEVWIRVNQPLLEGIVVLNEPLPPRRTSAWQLYARYAWARYIAIACSSRARASIDHDCYRSCFTGMPALFYKGRVSQHAWSQQ